MFPSGANSEGRIFNEWTDFQEDKLLYGGTTRAIGFNYSTAGILDVAGLTLSEDVWHHFAFVQDGPSNQQRMYVDGQLVGSQPASGDIRDSDGAPFIGAIERDGSLSGSFTGYMDSFRVSDVARYSGNSFSAPTGDFSSDANTQILYNFDAGQFVDNNGAIQVLDESGNGQAGTLGADGIFGMTSPVVPAGVLPTATETATATSTNTPTSTSVPATATNTATMTNTATSTPTSTATSTSVPTNTATSTSTSVPTNTATATNTATSTSTGTSTPTKTSTPTATATNTSIPTNTSTATSTSTATATNTVVAAATNTPASTRTARATATPRTGCADVNGDGRVDLRDAWLIAWHTFGRYDARYDVNGDGRVNWRDVWMALEQYGRRCRR
jgi:hypothetical protein